MNNNDLISVIMQQLAIDLSCQVADFQKEINTVVQSGHSEERRRFLTVKPFAHLACFGKGTVASVDEQVLGWFSRFVGKFDGYRCFDGAQLMAMNHELRKYQMCLPSLGEYFLPDVSMDRAVDVDYEISVFHDEEIRSLYADDRFGMALSYEDEGERRDVIAAIAIEDEKIMGVAGASNDTDLLYQIGIDVLPEYRQRGIAVALTNVLTEEILRRGKIPYYGTCWSNIGSRKVARKCGYFPAWVEMNAISFEEARGFVGEDI